MNQKKTEELFQSIVMERAVGTEGNGKVLAILEEQLHGMGYEITKIPFSCITWSYSTSCIQYKGNKINIEASPFSEPFQGEGIVTVAGTRDELRDLDCIDKILVLRDQLVPNTLQPKNFPFYYPNEDKELIELLEEKKPAAIIATTGQSPMSGLNPFPLFEDGNFLIPSAYISNRVWEDVTNNLINQPVFVQITSGKVNAESNQLIASKKVRESKGKIVISAHMDTKYNTPGALDNGIGVVTLLETAKLITTEQYDIDIVPFNGEEYFEASGEVSYIDYLKYSRDTVKMMINIDSPCHLGSNIAVSTYNLDETTQQQVESIINELDHVAAGDGWYAGDHAAFAFQGIPCIAISSSDLFTGALEHTHSAKDIAPTVDLSLIDPAAKFILKLIQFMSKEYK